MILVNDGSTDRSRDIIEKYSYDKRIVIVDKHNGGLSDARNSGLDICTGKYVLFVDGDDYLNSDAIEKLMETVKENPGVEAVLFPYKKIRGDKEEKIELFDKNYMIFGYQEIEENIYQSLVGPDFRKSTPLTMDRLNTAWGKLYSREVIGDIRFTDTQYIGPEDGWFNIQVFQKCKKAVYTSQICYMYEKNNESSLLHSYSKNLLEKRWNMYALVRDHIRQNDQEGLIKNLANRMVAEQFGLLKNICWSGLEKQKKLAEINKVLCEKRYRDAYKKADLRGLSPAWRMFFYLCRKKKAKLINVIFMAGMRVVQCPG